MAAFVSTFTPCPALGRSAVCVKCVPERRPRSGRIVHASQESPSSNSPERKRAFKLDGARIATGVAAAALSALLLTPSVSLAASGGRIGGSSFRSAPRIQRMAPQRSYGGFGGGYGGYYGGYSPPIFMSPFLFPVGTVGFGGVGTVLLAGTAAAFVLNSVSNRRIEEEVVDTTRSAVVTLKIGLLSTARSLQVDLDRIARQADTSTSRGLSSVLSEAAVSLLRHPDYWVYGSVDVGVYRSGEDEFNRRSLEERVKIDEETLSNVQGRRMERTAVNIRDDPTEYIVVTVVAAANSSVVTRLPKMINSTSDIARALQTLGAVPHGELNGVEIIWSPQLRYDSLSREEMIRDHPELRRL